MRVEVLGIAPGYDVALIAVDWLPDSQLNTPQIQSWLHRIQERSLSPLAEAVHLAISGVPAFNFNMGTFVKNATWKDEAKWYAFWDHTPPLNYTVKDNYDPIKVPTTSVCPPMFLDECYRVPIRTNGFSGGVLIANPSANRDPGKTVIAGMISHYSPLTEWTYAIPWPKVVEVAQTLEKEFNKNQKSFFLRQDLTGSFEYVSQFELKVIDKASRYFGKKIQSEKFSSGFARVGGGGDFSGGGGDAAKGGDFSGGGGDAAQGGDFSGGGGDAAKGGDFSGGGGDAAKGGDFSGGGGNVTAVKGAQYYLVEDRINNIAGLAKFSTLVEEVKHPEKWFEPSCLFGRIVTMTLPFKGAANIFTYKPGVRIDGKKYLQLGSRSLFGLQDFVSALRTEPNGELTDDVRPQAVPVSFEIPEGKAGSEQYNYLQKFKANLDLSKIADSIPFLKRIRGSHRYGGDVDFKATHPPGDVQPTSLGRLIAKKSN